MLPKCEECEHLTIYEDASEDMRLPFGNCSLGFEIKNVGIMAWEPNTDCGKFSLGEPNFL